MTTFPNFLDTATTTLLGTKPLRENPHHRALLDAFIKVQNLEEQLLAAITTPPAPGAGISGLMEACTDLLIERLDAGCDLSELLSSDYCCAADRAVVEPCVPCGLETGEECCQEPAEPTAGLLDACCNVFAQLGHPHAVASADLVDALRHLPGIAGKHWRYSDLTQARLAELLAPHGMRTRDITLPDGRRRKSYSREALLTAMGVCTSC
ncbi:DUF3631 domain-containing protein [Streptomyces sp. H34-S4]|uniref:DUF3631 domain-containing protein n=1 Tax=Streptomyces sp. H34-S4 TaxID=2996463 RepID=UPI00226E9C84|nr:DUF3631 domain-containing protein [Streptomyces sp. H34-S4]MCY0933813.1 DUF3631 domain-containing protein [Streptomyces sp. H34-S4]